MWRKGEKWLQVLICLLVDKTDVHEVWELFRLLVSLHYSSPKYKKHLFASPGRKITQLLFQVWKKCKAIKKMKIFSKTKHISLLILNVHIDIAL